MREEKKVTRERERENHGGHNGCPLCRVMGMETPSLPPLYRLLAKYFPVG